MAAACGRLPPSFAMCRQTLKHDPRTVLLSCRQSQSRHRPPLTLLRHPQSPGSFQHLTAQTEPSARATTHADDATNAISESKFSAELQRQHQHARGNSASKILVAGASMRGRIRVSRRANSRAESSPPRCRTDAGHVHQARISTRMDGMGRQRSGRGFRVFLAKRRITKSMALNPPGRQRRSTNRVADATCEAITQVGEAVRGQTGEIA